MSNTQRALKQVEHWRREADEGNPAGSLFTGGDYAEAEIVLRTTGGSGRCGTVCTGSVRAQCC